MAAVVAEELEDEEIEDSESDKDGIDGEEDINKGLAAGKKPGTKRSRHATTVISVKKGPMTASEKVQKRSSAAAAKKAAKEERKAAKAAAAAAAGGGGGGKGGVASKKESEVLKPIIGGEHDGFEVVDGRVQVRCEV